MCTILAERFGNYEMTTLLPETEILRKQRHTGACISGVKTPTGAEPKADDYDDNIRHHSGAGSRWQWTIMRGTCCPDGWSNFVVARPRLISSHQAGARIREIIVVAVDKIPRYCTAHKHSCYHHYLDCQNVATAHLTSRQNLLFHSTHNSL